MFKRENKINTLFSELQTFYTKLVNILPTTEHINKDLIEKVEALRIRKKLKREVTEIAEKTGYSKGQVSSYINGKVKASQNFMLKFNEVFRDVLKTQTSVNNFTNTEEAIVPNSELINYNIPIGKQRIAVITLPLNAGAKDIDKIISHLKLMKEAME